MTARWIAALAALAALAATPWLVAQDATPARATPGRFASPPVPIDLSGYTGTLDTWTGTLYLAQGEPGTGSAIVLDLPNAQATIKPLAKDMSAGGVVVLPPVPNPAGTGAPAFAWAPVRERALAVLDTRSGVHYLLEGKIEPGETPHVHRTDLRLSTRSTRELRIARPEGK